MRQSIVHVALVVRDYDEESFLFLNTDDFWRDYNDMVAKGIKFIREPKNEPYGIVAVCKSGRTAQKLLARLKC